MELEPVSLRGSAETRGRQQAALVPDAVSAVRAAVESRLEKSAELLRKAPIRRFLEDQWAFLSRHAPSYIDEITGVAEGFGISAGDISAYLHLGILDHGSVAVDGCSTFAASDSDFGPFVAKNRDYGGDHRALQKVFLHSDPDNTKKRCIFVGSLGSPGAFSSGMNSAGLALADTRIDWQTPGIGWLRYGLMTEILWRADTVEEAVDFITSVPHAGGGSLALADASGEIASVEFGHPDALVRSSADGSFAHTNHYIFDRASNADQATEGGIEDDSLARLRVLRKASVRHTRQTNMTEIIDLFSSHGDGAGNLCRHASDGEQSTISTAIFCCEAKELYFFAGNPCESEPQRVSF